ncbi:unnamed protein product [Rotaria socialis]|uniref:Uncharacterized protein n=3 Tax=Rotaria TaxID=231623 RepID=A0A821S415_9BILA|nr:unnamed protein product [Rotaria socialis]CAF4849143.1 unnamed protein product [Rotaria socialis]
MFLTVENTANTNNSYEQMASHNEATQPNSLSRTGKRFAIEDINVEIKKTKTETPMLEQKVSMPSAANTAAVKFVSASTMVVPLPEITDEELLEFTLEFERKHGI